MQPKTTSPFAAKLVLGVAVLMVFGSFFLFFRSIGTTHIAINDPTSKVDCHSPLVDGECPGELLPNPSSSVTPTTRTEPKPYSASAKNLACAQEGDAVCQRNLAYYYSTGQGGVGQDNEAAFYWLKLSAEQGDAAAQDDLGVMYGDGRGVAQDWVKSYLWIWRAAQQGEKRAPNDLLYVKARMSEQEWQQAQRLIAEELR